MIPKIIHYMWFGNNPLPDLAKKCIDSWKKYCPDYEIKLWNESNYDVNKNEYMRQSYLVGKYGFTVDYARLDIIYQYGGIYLDTDVELIRPIDGLLDNGAFMGFETDRTVALGLGFGAEAGNEVIRDLMEVYNLKQFLKEDGSLDLTPSPSTQTKVMINKYGLNGEGKEQVVGDRCHIYPKKVFNPYDLNTGKINISPETLSIHHYLATWATETNRRNTKIYQLLYRIAGDKFTKKVRSIAKKIKNIDC